ncbi:CHAP domain-containing protein [Skermanella pratensis]|uniref:CHAP domain-containing protein n=1 Tax=Skermanella pratensis TaxID=2233999 RepID=UPI0017887D44|nr:CHAP domain-containing protein [Skermanella pratensis]
MSGPALAGYVNCVQFVRQAGAIELSGNAWMWWPQARGRYETGQRPHRDAVMVFQRTKAMPFGHVALVRHVLESRMIVVEHANWAPRDGAKGRISRDLVQDVSPANDWTAVRVLYRPTRSFGKVYAANGFIHPNPPAPAEQIIEP